MATSLAVDKPHLPPGDADANDPFVSPPGPANQRYSGYDSQFFALGPGASPDQAKRALQAHIADTERRLDEAGKLGTALVQQRKELAERLKEVEEQQTEGELTPDLRSKLVEIEKEFNDVARETARAFLPKQRVPSNEAAGGSPYVPDGKMGRRSVSPSKFENIATGSPSKLSVPNRKVRNQPSSRIHDIEFAAEISTSLIAQVRNLQSLLAEKDEELKDTKAEKSRLEIETESFQQRVKTLDESENRYKDENWNLETQVHDLVAAQKDAADREKKLTQSLNVLQAEKNSAQKELDEAKVSIAKLTEEHERFARHLDLDLTTAKKNAAVAETERNALQRKVDDLMSQNQELARAISSQRGRLSDRDFGRLPSDEDLDSGADGFTPEHSPPPSPIKGTPRHAMLESETLKSSLLHAQRTIQSQKTVIHREKTEKLELKRLLQDTRDELEKLRTDAAPAPARRNRKVESREFKKPSRGLLGGHRHSRNEIYTDDAEWEEATEIGSPRTSPTSYSTSTVRRPGSRMQITDTSDQFDTANETSDAAFETANERGTETEDFQTGAEDLSGSDSGTETESPSKGRELRQNFALSGGRNSYDSTASTSADEDDDYVEYVRTPTSQHSHQRMRVKLSRGLLNRRSRQASEEPAYQSSPASAATGSAAGTPQAGGQSLFAELAELETSDAESVEGTPSRARSATPSADSEVSQATTTIPSLSLTTPDTSGMTDPVKRPAAPRPAMVDSGMMTEPMVRSPPMSPVSVVHDDRDIPSLGSLVAANQISDGLKSRPLSTISYSDAGAQYDMDEKLAQFPMPPSPNKQFVLPPLPELSMSSIDIQDIEPVVEPETPLPAPAPLTMTSIPIAEPEAVVPTPDLTMSALVSEDIEPKAEPEPEAVRAVPAPIPVPTPAPAPILSLSSIASEHVEPKAEPEVVQETPVLSLSALYAHNLEPRAEPAILPPALTLSSIVAENVEPKAEPEIVLQLAFSSIAAENIEPREEPEIIPAPPTLSLTAIASEDIEPKAELPPTLTLSSLSFANIEPLAEPEVLPPPPPALSLSSIASENIEPKAEPEVLAPPPAILAYSNIHSQAVSPRADPVPSLDFSTLLSQQVEPVQSPEAKIPKPNFAFSNIESIETHPISPRSPKRDGFIIPADMESPFDEDVPRTPKNGLMGSVFGRGKNKAQADPIIAEDETRQSPSEVRPSETPESQRPFKEISTNANGRPARKATIQTTDMGAQTSLTAEAIDEMLLAKAQPVEAQDKSSVFIGTPNSSGTVRIRRPSHDSLSSISTEQKMGRPSSASSNRMLNQPLPPLPTNHKEAIEAARTGSRAGSSQGSMGPPLWPASAMRSQRPQTPNGGRPQSPLSIVTKNSATPRMARAGPSYGTAEVAVQSPTKLSTMSRQSSVSSFVSEIDHRFNPRNELGGMDPSGFGANTDPRMIQAITSTMIGEYLWKYTRKAGRGEISEHRHRRYFWVHPYTRTLYWSDRDPAAAGRSELRGKSVPIEAVRVVTDDNPMPPGLHRKSLIVISPGRTIKFTCTTGQRHETWFNALSYLLLRTADEGQSDVEEMAGHITQADVDEFNPQFGRRTNSTARPRPPPSVSSYNSRTTRNQSPAIDMSMNVPTLTPNKGQAQRPSIGTLGRISGYFNTFSSMRSRSGVAPNSSIYEASEVHDSAEDLREIIERQDRDADRLENVRACCDGKHDVGTLHHHSKRGQPSGSHSHSQPGRSASAMSTLRSRA
ncbi:PH domain-containing protein [Colletotrichum sp. SAR 10_70]|nr:PH domain-containing protein [Colletotrichum sp. SAR 10_71]KAI8166182.1 PH domain-containing protein [Colletotrichum sp. SAR 10_70]